MSVLLAKVVLFSILGPGTVAVLAPYLLLRYSGGFNWPFCSLAVILACALCLFCGGLLLSCTWEFVVRGQGTPAPVDPPKALVIRGPYRYNRNPMYVGIMGIIAAEALFFASFFLLVYAAVLWLGFHLFVLLYEEPHLEKKFGPSYQEYCRLVPRWGIALNLWKKS